MRAQGGQLHLPLYWKYPYMCYEGNRSGFDCILSAIACAFCTGQCFVTPQEAMSCGERVLWWFNSWTNLILYFSSYIKDFNMTFTCLISPCAFKWGIFRGGYHWKMQTKFLHKLFWELLMKLFLFHWHSLNFSYTIYSSFSVFFLKNESEATVALFGQNTLHAKSFF